MDDYTDSNLQMYDSDDKSKTTRRIVIGAILVLAVGIGIGVLIGWFSHTYEEPVPCDGACVSHKMVSDGDEEIWNKIKERMSAQKIDENLKKFTEYPHLGGTPEEQVLADELVRMWTTEQKLDHVTQVTYDVLLSYPNRSSPNFVHLMQNGVPIYTTQAVEKPLGPQHNRSDVVPPFNAYAKAGIVENDLVYVNYGSIDDFKELTDNYGINVSGKIVIARYGNIFRGDKVEIAASHGAIGVILYSDPADYVVNLNDSVFPDSWWLPGTGVQRGTVLIGDGDPLTPGYPATDTAYRTKSPELPTIPVHPIGYEDAYQFLSRLSGTPVNSSWQGGLNFTYHTGPGFTETNMKVRLEVATYTERVNTSNVFGFINGSIEPDRYVLLGNHRDAWVFGSVDPTSGTAVMMEVSRVLMDIVHTEGWRPRRTIVFCSWGSEEYGLIASTEWVEQQVKALSDRAVAYLNVDIAVEGMDSMRAKGVPLLYDLLYNVSKKVPSGNNAAEPLYDEWLRFFPQKDAPLPRINAMGGGSDFVSFIGFSGVPCIDIRYTHNYSIIDYPLYHSAYETYELVKDHMDPQFKRSLAMGQYWAEIARMLAETLVLPLNVSTYAETMTKYIHDLDLGYGDIMRQNNITLDGLSNANNRFTAAAKSFQERLSKANRANPLEMRMYNDQLMRVERAFIDSNGLPGRPLKKHVIFAPSSFDSYAGATFPGLVDLMYGIEELPEPAKSARWEQVKEHLATIVFCTDSATFGLREWMKFSELS